MNGGKISILHKNLTFLFYCLIFLNPNEAAKQSYPLVCCLQTVSIDLSGPLLSAFNEKKNRRIWVQHTNGLSSWLLAIDCSWEWRKQGNFWVPHLKEGECLWES